MLSLFPSFSIIKLDQIPVRRNNQTYPHLLWNTFFLLGDYHKLIPLFKS